MRIISVLSILATVLYVRGDDNDVFIENKADGLAYKIKYHSQTWHRAKEECEKEGATLAVPKSQEEFQFIQKLVRGMYYPHITGTKYKLLVWLGINNLDDYKVWKNIYGENINSTGFHTWASTGVGYSDDPKEPHCVGMDAANPGLRDYWCHLRQPYICQKKVDPSLTNVTN